MKTKLPLLLLVVLHLSTAVTSAENVDSIINRMQYEGAFRLPVGTFGASRLGFASGIIAINSENNSFFIVGHAQHQAIAEFSIPEAIKSNELVELNFSQNIQPFSRTTDRVEANPNGSGTITGMKIDEGRLIVNAGKYYDGTGSNTETTYIVEDPNNLESSKVTGFFRLDAKHHASGWISDVPLPLRQELGFEYIFGNASNLPINLRNSMGPSAFGVKKESLADLSTLEIIPTVTMLDFSIENQLHPSHYNTTGDNDLWTEISNAFYGFIVPGTRTYLVIGNSGGHEFGIGYKIRGCGGACSIEPKDIYNYYWAWYLDDLIEVKNGQKLPHEAKPYEYGKLNLPFENISDAETPRLMRGAYYDMDQDLLLILIGGVDALQNKNEKAPIMLVYNLGLNRPKSPSWN